MRDYWGIIDGSVVPPDKLDTITVTEDYTGEALKEKRKNQRPEKLTRWGTGT